MEIAKRYEHLPESEREDFRSTVEKYGRDVSDFEVTYIERWDPSGVVQVISRSISVRAKWPHGRSVAFDGPKWLADLDDALSIKAFG